MITSLPEVVLSDTKRYTSTDIANAGTDIGTAIDAVIQATQTNDADEYDVYFIVRRRVNGVD